MAQIFHRSTNTLSKVSIFGGAIFVVALVSALAAFNRSSFVTEVGVARGQPVPFSHKHHVGDDGIDCRYCHTSVEKSAFAGLPSTETCMTCHSQIFSDAQVLAPVRRSLSTRTPLKWNRVHDLPDFVYFDHSIHIAKGIGCSTCHGRIDQMPITWKVNTLYMKWCLDCHKQPQNYVRPRDKIYDMAWQPVQDRQVDGAKLVAQYHIDTSGRLTNCSVCHR